MPAHAVNAPQKSLFRRIATAAAKEQKSGSTEIPVFNGEIIVGLFVSLANIAIQAVASVALIRLMRTISRRYVHKRKILSLLLVMMITAAVLTIAHLIQVGVWSLAYDALGAVTLVTDSYYLAFVNFTTLGYGDILPANEWRLLGPMTAANGMLLFGWSTALMFAVLSRATRLLQLN